MEGLGRVGPLYVRSTGSNRDEVTDGLTPRGASLQVANTDVASHLTPPSALKSAAASFVAPPSASPSVPTQDQGGGASAAALAKLQAQLKEFAVGRSAPRDATSSRTDFAYRITTHRMIGWGLAADCHAALHAACAASLTLLDAIVYLSHSMARNEP